MIKLKIEKYCHNCPHFEADCSIEVGTYVFNNELVECNTYIYCSNRDKCRLILEYLKKGINDDQN